MSKLREPARDESCSRFGVLLFNTVKKRQGIVYASSSLEAVKFFANKQKFNDWTKGATVERPIKSGVENIGRMESYKKD